MQHNEQEIMISYRGAKNHKKQISILAQLNACSEEYIREIVKRNGAGIILNNNKKDISLQASTIKEYINRGFEMSKIAKMMCATKKQILEVLKFAGIEQTQEERTEEKPTVKPKPVARIKPVEPEKLEPDTDSGISLELHDFCSYCPDFEADVEKLDITSLDDRYQKVKSVIKCYNSDKCIKIHERMKEREKE